MRSLRDEFFVAMITENLPRQRCVVSCQRPEYTDRQRSWKSSFRRKQIPRAWPSAFTAMDRRRHPGRDHVVIAKKYLGPLTPIHP